MNAPPSSWRTTPRGEIALQGALVAFYRGEGCDTRGRSIESVLCFDERDLERIHDYIQWLFPLPVPSEFNAAAPVLTAEDGERFRSDAKLQATLRRAFEMMLRFYGLEFCDPDPGYNSIRPTARFAERARVWLTPENHNYLRLSRILQSVRLLGHADWAEALLAILEDLALEHPDDISQLNLRYWRRAVGGNR